MKNVLVFFWIDVSLILSINAHEYVYLVCVYNIRSLLSYYSRDQPASHRDPIYTISFLLACKLTWHHQITCVYVCICGCFGTYMLMYVCVCVCVFVCVCVCMYVCVCAYMCVSICGGITGH